MVIVYSITPKMREKLEKPFGTLIPGSVSSTTDRFEKLIRKEKPTRIISVGDVVSRSLHANNINPQLSIVDNKSLRKKIKQRLFEVESVIYINNPKGTITEEAVSTIKRALEGGAPTQIIVNGEEDLLTLIAVAYAPNDSFVVYGQPYKGIVVVRVTEENKAEVNEVLEEMKKS